MSGKTSIAWTDTTWNPVTGCTKVSAGCKNCYAEAVADRWWKGRKFTDVRLHPERMNAPKHWRKPRRVFVNSMSDLFHEAVPDGFIAWVWHVMAHCPQHTFQILTKRPQRMRDWCKRWADTVDANDLAPGDSMPPMPRGPAAIRATYKAGRALLFADMLEQWGEPPAGAAYSLYDWQEGQRWWPATLPNVWLGVSCENQEAANARIPWLLATPAALRFLSCEPLLGPIDLHSVVEIDPKVEAQCALRPVDGDGAGCDALRGTRWRGRLGYDCPRVDWVIVGGESGPGFRAMNLAWAQSLREQCRAARVAFFFKQNSGRWSGMDEDALGELMQEFPEGRR